MLSHCVKYQCEVGTFLTLGKLDLLTLIVRANVTNPQSSVGKLSPQETHGVLTLSFGYEPLKISRASSELLLGDSFSTLPFRFVTVSFTL